MTELTFTPVWGEALKRQTSQSPQSRFLRLVVIRAAQNLLIYSVQVGVLFVLLEWRCGKLQILTVESFSMSSSDAPSDASPMFWVEWTVVVFVFVFLFY